MFFSSIIKEIQNLKPSQIFIGYSGGIDSSVIIEIVSKINDVPITAIHINHAINHNADNWENHCRTICFNKNIQFISHKLEKAPKGESFEAWASNQRMAFFEKQMSAFDNPLLILGHHLDDQAETFLIQAIRGAGPAGLSSMPKLRKLNHGYIFRPLLDIPRKDIEEFAYQNKITWVDDDSNEDIKYQRNFIRHKIVPLLKEINPSINQTLTRSANLCAKNHNTLSKLLKKQLDSILENKQLILEKLINQDTDIQENILHLWFKENTGVSLKASQTESIINALNTTALTGWQVSINNYSLCLTYGKLSILKQNNTYSPSSPTKDNVINWLKANNIFDINFSDIIVREKKPSDKCRYIGRNKENKLKILFQELNIPAAKRDIARVIELNSQIIAVYPFFICH
ncbi:tRNA lysidine(34) synthetase TilS [Francisella frigiditurris]|uniref:tRNA(Ile)-lysidine synthase n=1 Tax=Francisella frigiditurris TaxID=1542390 RepID=A0A1J0KVK9_9GAMM|nr:tRNA lysidine(34) synthetase TilS [Francisella frigiditurris]APC97727.1 tRNA(Ile)-lysidine synthetase [Francisella frigiditurris]